jgi:hypothetical protein
MEVAVHGDHLRGGVIPRAGQLPQGSQRAQIPVMAKILACGPVISASARVKVPLPAPRSAHVPSVAGTAGRMSSTASFSRSVRVRYVAAPVRSFHAGVQLPDPR